MLLCCEQKQNVVCWESLRYREGNESFNVISSRWLVLFSRLGTLFWGAGEWHVNLLVGSRGRVIDERYGWRVGPLLIIIVIVILAVFSILNSPGIDEVDMSSTLPFPFTPISKGPYLHANPLQSTTHQLLHPITQHHTQIYPSASIS